MPSAANHKSKRPQFCISLLPKSMPELEAQLMACDEADLIEIRLDLFWRFTVKKELSPNLTFLYQNKPLILALRTKEEGGLFSGAPSEIFDIYESAHKFFRQGQNALEMGLDYYDISYSIANSVFPQLKLNKSAKIILSCHTKENDVDHLKREIEGIIGFKADVYKLVFTANNINDNITALDLMDFAKGLNIPFIIHAQDDEGKLSRIIGSFKGNLWTYVSLGENQKTAEGQLSYHEARHQYYLQNNNLHTKIIGLVGHPVSQSKGWLLYNRIFNLGGIDKTNNASSLNYIYLNFPTKDSAKFWEMWQKRLVGLSVTIPHKEHILKYVHQKSVEVEQSGVCNTLVKRNNSWEAHNTDLLAIVELLKPYAGRLEEGDVLLYGTGATTRSAIVALRRLNVQNIIIMGRNIDRGRLLADLFSASFAEENAVPSNLSAIIQTTPVGMHPHIDQIPKCIEYLKSGMIAFDVVFNPPLTRFLRTAKDIGCITISGEEMYLHQAALQFELFTSRAISIGDLQRIWNEL